jgi:hypothetical protein
MKNLILAILLVAGINQAHAAATATIRVPVINEQGKFLHVAHPEVPKFLTFKDRSACDTNQGYTFRDEISIWDAGHPSDFARAGVPLCYTGDATEAMNILLDLADCVLSDQFVVNRRFVQDGVIHIENSSNDEGDDVTWSTVRKCH